MNLDDLKASGRIAFECVAGSHMYGLNIPSSDVDLKGIYILPASNFNCLDQFSPPLEVANDTQDIKYYELQKFMSLAVKCNPNIIEMLWPPDDCVRIMTPAMKMLMDHRSIFISKAAAKSYICYAHDQIGKATGQNKMVNNPQSKDPPKKEDFCWIVDADSMIGANPPFRPRPLHQVMENGDFPPLSHCHAAGLEHVGDTYRLYMYGPEAKGVFRGNDMLVTESIPVEDECNKFVGLLIYHKQNFEACLRDWKRYWTWMDKRNEARWIDKDGGKFTYDHKNMCHCLRLLKSGIHILKTGEPKVKFVGEEREFIMNVRLGHFEYDYLMSKADELNASIRELEVASQLPANADLKAANNLLQEIRNCVDKNPSSMLQPSP